MSETKYVQGAFNPGTRIVKKKDFVNLEIGEAVQIDGSGSTVWMRVSDKHLLWVTALGSVGISYVDEFRFHAPKEYALIDPGSSITLKIE